MVDELTKLLHANLPSSCLVWYGDEWNKKTHTSGNRHHHRNHHHSLFIITSHFIILLLVIEHKE